MNRASQTVDQRWSALADRHLLEQPLGVDELAFLHAHEACDPATREEQRIFRELAGLGHGEGVPRAEDDACVRRAVEALQAAPARRAFGVRPWIAGLAAAAAVVGLASATQLGRPAESDQGVPTRVSASERSSASARPSSAPESEAAPPRSLGPGWSEVGGRWQPAATQAVAALPARWQAAAGSCASHARGVLCTTATAVLELGAERVELEAGAVTWRADPIAGPVVISVRVAGTAIELHGTSYEVETVAPHGIRARALTAALELREGDRPVKTLRPGERFDTGTRSEPARARPDPRGPGETLARARTLRSAGRYREAATLYEQLAHTAPTSEAGRSAWVSLGQLRLGPLSDPAGALSAFDRYLERAGELREEALHGRVQALRRLGRAAEAAAARRAFAREFPASPHVREAGGVEP